MIWESGCGAKWVINNLVILGMIARVVALSQLFFFLFLDLSSIFR